MNYWSKLYLCLAERDINEGRRINQFYNPGADCSVQIKARGVSSLLDTVFSTIHQNLCLQIKIDDKATFYDYTKTETILKKLNIPHILKLRLIVEGRICPLHGSAVFEKANSFQQGRIYIIQNSELDIFLKQENKVTPGYTDQYHTRTSLIKVLTKHFPQEYEYENMRKIENLIRYGTAISNRI